MLEKLRILLWIVAMVACAAFYVYYRRNAPRHGMDSINVYKMRFRGVPIFNRFRSFVRDMGLPETIKVKGETRPVSSVSEISEEAAVARSNGYELTLQYDGFEMNYFHDGRVVMMCMDMRRPGMEIQYRGATFNVGYTFGEFSRMFPNSSQIDVSGVGSSLFEIQTGEAFSGTESYLLLRYSKDSFFADPVVEFTFRDGRLIFVFFANF